LGVTIKSDFKWERHIKQKVTEATDTLRLLRTLFGAPVEVKEIAYKTLCRPKLEFAAEVWDPFYQKDIQTLESVQSRAVRYILELKGRASVSQAKASLGLESLQDRRKAQRINVFHRILVNSGEHPSFDELNNMIDLF
jgi:hypothetical protein